MRALDRKLIRDLWRIRGQALAIALVIGSGVATVVLMHGTVISLRETRDAYYERYRFADVFAPVKRAPRHLARRIARIPGVARAEARIVKDVTLDIAGMTAPATGRLISMPAGRAPALNGVALRHGRWLAPGRVDEALISEAFAEAHAMAPGARLHAVINGAKRRLTIVGIALSPEYVYAISPGEMVPDDRRFGVLWMADDVLEAAYDLKGAFNEVSVALLRGASVDAVIDDVDRLLEPYGGTGAYARRDQVSHAYLDGEMDMLAAMGRIVSPIFLAVAAFLLNIVISRLIDTEREQIGLLKAFGYGNVAVGWHYLKLVAILTGFGVALGCAGGAWLGRGLTEFYTQFFRFPFLHYQLSPAVFAIAGLVSVAAALAGTLGAVRRAVTLAPAVAMVPAPPTSYRGALDFGATLGRAISQPTRMILRHLARWPVRAGLTAFGISLSVTILVGSMFSLDAIEHMVDVLFFQAQRQDITVTFNEPGPGRVLADLKHLPGVLAAEPFRAVPVRLRHGHRARRLVILGLAPGADLNRLLDVSLRPIEPPSTGLVLSTKLARLLAARPGDRIIVEAMEGRRPVKRIRVSAIVEEYIGINAYMTIGALNRMMGEGAVVSGAYLLVDPGRADALYGRLKETPAVAGSALHGAALAAFRATMAEMLTMITLFYIGFAATIAFGVVYNSARIALSERARELSTLRVMGFTRGEVSYILLGELAILTLAALPLGCVLGYGLAWIMTLLLDTDMFRVPLVVERATYGIAISVVLVSALVSGLIVRRRINRLDLVAVLKTRE